MKIGYLIGALGAGGSERQLAELASGMAARGHAVEIAAYDGPGAFDRFVEERGVTVRRMHGGSKRVKLAAVRKWAQRFQPELMHGFMKRASGVAVLANLPRRRCRIVASDFSTATYSRGQPALWAALTLFAFADRVATQTEMNRRSLGLLAPWLRSRTTVVRNGVDTTRFNPVGGSVQDGFFRFLSVGTVYRLKNPIRVVEAARILRNSRSDFSIDWVGKWGQDGEKSEDYVRAAALVRRYRLQDVVRFLGPSERMEDVYRRYDGLVHVSLQDGIPNAVVEGMACGLPVVVSQVSDLPLIVAEARNGFVCDQKDPTSIAGAMQRMIDCADSEQREMGERSRDLAVRWFDLQRFIDEYEALYCDIVSGRS